MDCFNSTIQLLGKERFTWQAMEGHKQYCKISGHLNHLTAALTSLLMCGEIRTPVGTRSLLGEGSDAPALNSLVLASTVGSFMLTNQMRGRAIRVDKHVPGKVGSIWHIVAMDTENVGGLSDYCELRGRFSTFVE